jgi:hypothetical protein
LLGANIHAFQLLLGGMLEVCQQQQNQLIQLRLFA